MSFTYTGCQTGRWSSTKPNYSSPPMRTYIDCQAQRLYKKLHQAEVNAQRAYDRRDAWSGNYWRNVATKLRKKLYPMPKVMMWTTTGCNGTLAADLRSLELQLWSGMGLPSNRSALIAKYEFPLESLPERSNQPHDTLPTPCHPTSSSPQGSENLSPSVSSQAPDSV